MIRDLVLYFLRQGLYSGPGDIAVLCAYLGQLTKVRAALRDLKIAVAVDERDAEQLARQGMEEPNDIEYEEVNVGKHVSSSIVSAVVLLRQADPLSFAGPSGHGRHLPGPRSENCDRFAGAKLRADRFKFCVYRFSQGLSYHLRIDFVGSASTVLL